MVEANKENFKNFLRAQAEFEDIFENHEDIQVVKDWFDIAQEEIKNYRFNPGNIFFLKSHTICRKNVSL